MQAGIYECGLIWHHADDLAMFRSLCSKRRIMCKKKVRGHGRFATQFARIDSRKSFTIETPIFMGRQADSPDALEFLIRTNHATKRATLWWVMQLFLSYLSYSAGNHLQNPVLPFLVFFVFSCFLLVLIFPGFWGLKLPVFPVFFCHFPCFFFPGFFPPTTPPTSSQPPTTTQSIHPQCIPPTSYQARPQPGQPHRNFKSKHPETKEKQQQLCAAFGKLCQNKPMSNGLLKYSVVLFAFLSVLLCEFFRGKTNTEIFVL